VITHWAKFKNVTDHFENWTMPKTSVIKAMFEMD